MLAQYTKLNRWLASFGEHFRLESLATLGAKKCLAVSHRRPSTGPSCFGCLKSDYKKLNQLLGLESCLVKKET